MLGGGCSHCDILSESSTGASSWFCSVACPSAPISSLILCIPPCLHSPLPHQPLPSPDSPDSLASNLRCYITYVPFIPCSFLFVLLFGLLIKEEKQQHHHTAMFCHALTGVCLHINLSFFVFYFLWTLTSWPTNKSYLHTHTNSQTHTLLFFFI